MLGDPGLDRDSLTIRLAEPRRRWNRSGSVERSNKDDRNQQANMNTQLGSVEKWLVPAAVNFEGPRILSCSGTVLVGICSKEECFEEDDVPFPLTSGNFGLTHADSFRAT